MANSGTIEQFQGPFEEGYEINFIPNICRLGISISEDDFMKNQNFSFTLNGQTIQMGKTQIYEMEQPTVNTSLIFPDGAPASVLVNCVYHE